MDNRVIIKKVKPRGPNRPKPGLINPLFCRVFVTAAVGGGEIVLTREFYKSVGIRQKRWGLLMKGELSPEVDEIQRIAQYFSKKILLKTGFVHLDLFSQGEKVLTIEL